MRLHIIVYAVFVVSLLFDLATTIICFQVDGLNITTVTSRYDPNYMPIYALKGNENIPTPVTVNVWDHRGIKVIAQKT